MNVTIVGGGIMGLATAWGLHRLGHRFTLIDQGPIPNPHGASADEHRVIRHAYGSASGYTRMVDDAYAAWDTLWADLSERLYVPTGVLALAADGNDWVHRSAETMAAQGRVVRWLERGELERAFPLLAPDGIEAAFLVASGGILLADRITAALAAYLNPRGAIKPMARVREIDPDRARVTLDDGTVIEADALVISAGAWVGRLVPGFTRRVTPSRQVLAYLAPPSAYAARWTIAPVIIEIGGEVGFYLVPPAGGTRMKIGDHRFSLSGNPDDDRAADLSEAESSLAACKRRLRQFERYRLLQLRACYYAVEPNERFVVEPLGAQSWVLSACSGHAFKFGALLGLRVAESVVGAGTAHPDISLWAAGEAA